MKISILLLVICSCVSFAATGDTIRVKVMDEYLWTWNGYQDRWAQFPSTQKTFEKILLRYTLKCPTGGCGEWDYTTGVICRQHTGIIDSTLRDAANFTVSGTIYDSIALAGDTTWSTSYNSTKKKTDTTANAPYTIYWYDNPNAPFTPTDSGIAWKANYWNYLYSNTGAKIDSFYVAADTVLYATKWKAYYKYERVIPFELTRFITPYGKGFPKDWTRTWTVDVTDFASLLHDSVEIRSFYDGWSQGSLYSLEFVLIEGTPPRTTYEVEQIYNGYFSYGNANDPIEDHLPERKLFRDANADLVTLRLTVSGHGSDPNGASEFIDKTHSIWANGEERYQQRLWRDDCGLNPTYPQTGTYWFPRGGWCPGDLVYPFDYDLTPFTAKSDSFTVDYNMEDYESSDPTGGYNVHGLVFYSSGPNFDVDAAAEDVKQPTSDFRYVRQNPICNGMSPVVVIRNNGKTPLTSCMIGYWIDDQFTNEYYWTGNLDFLEKAEVALPAMDLGAGEHTFHFRVFFPNGTQDQYANNDHFMTSYTSPKTYSNKIAFQLRTDKVPAAAGIENAIRWELLDGGSGMVIEEGGGYADGVTVRDTFTLAAGCYRFNIYDEGLGEGLFPWIISGYTAGSYSLKDDKNATIVNAISSNNSALFGNRQTTTFTVIPPLGVGDQPKAVASLNVHPNPAHDQISVDLAAFAGVEVTIALYDALGKLIFEKQSNSASESLDVRSLPVGSYVVRVESSAMKVSERVVIE